MNDEFLGNDFGSLSLNHHKGSFGSEVLQLQTTMKEVGLVVLGFFFFQVVIERAKCLLFYKQF